MYYDRTDAANRLAIALNQYARKKDVVVVGIPRGGMIPAYVLSKELEVPMDVVLVKKIGHPSNPEYAIGAVSMDDYILDKHEGVSNDYVQTQVHKLRKMLMEREQEYGRIHDPVNLEGKIVIVVDDGVATGKTFIASIKIIKSQNPKEIIAAFPVGSKSAVREISKLADKVVCLNSLEQFRGVGYFYEKFNQVSDDEVVRILKNHKVI